MIELVWRAWRVFATGLCFALFGIGGVLLRVLVFPLLSLLTRGATRRSASRAVIRHTMRGFVGVMRLLGVLRYEVSGLDKLDRGGLLILANHPTLIDTVFLIAFVRNADCIVKGALWRNAVTCGPVRAAGYIKNDQGPQLIDDCMASLRDGGNLIVFPEGTRTPVGGAIALKRGAANIAVRASRAVTPVVISCDPPTLGKGDKWWQVPPRQASFRIEVKDDIGMEPFTGAGITEGLAARRLTEHLQHYFMEEGRRHA
jgi:1-acyl-sn-glycerol-3-phosphate acyltransferase